MVKIPHDTVSTAKQIAPFERDRVKTSLKSNAPRIPIANAVFYDFWRFPDKRSIKDLLSLMALRIVYLNVFCFLILNWQLQVQWPKSFSMPILR